MKTDFGAYRLSAKTRQVSGPEGALDLSARSFDLLCVLLERPGQIVSKDQLLAAAWPGLIVEDNTLQVHISALRKALGTGMILTVHGRGYKYVGPDPVALTEPESQQYPLATKTATGREKSTAIAVLPFKNLSDDAKQDMFAEGLTEDIITELARYRHLSVIGYRITLAYRDRGRDLASLSAELAVDFILEGSLRLAGSTVRVAVQLIDAETGAQVWGDRFDREMVDIFAVQDEILAAVIGQLAYNLDEAAGKKRQKNPTSSTDAYMHFLQSRVAWRNGEMQVALDNVLKAIELDPGYARAHAHLGFFYGWNLFMQSIDVRVADSIEKARKAIERALAIDRVDPFVLHRAAITYLMIGEPLTGLRYAVAAAVESPRDSEILIVRGTILSYCGYHDQGVEMLERAVALERRLSPSAVSTLAECLFNKRDYAGSLAVLETTPDPPLYYLVQQAGCLARLGRLVEARLLIEQVPEGYSVSQCVECISRACALPEDAQHWLESFRPVGVAV